MCASRAGTLESITVTAGASSGKTSGGRRIVVVLGLEERLCYFYLNRFAHLSVLSTTKQTSNKTIQNKREQEQEQVKEHTMLRPHRCVSRQSQVDRGGEKTARKPGTSLLYVQLTLSETHSQLYRQTDDRYFALFAKQTTQMPCASEVRKNNNNNRLATLQDKKDPNRRQYDDIQRDSLSGPRT